MMYDSTIRAKRQRFNIHIKKCYFKQRFLRITAVAVTAESEVLFITQLP